MKTTIAPPADLMVSVVIPCLNEEHAIGGVVRQALAGIAALGVPGEVLVVDNASTDRTAEEAEGAGARVVVEPLRGYGNAYKRGFAEARGRYLVMADGDGTYPVDDLRPFIELLDQGFDMVNGDRFGGSMESGAMDWSHQYIGTPVLSWMVRGLAGARLRDSQCGMRAFRREALHRLDLRAPGMEFASEMLVKAARARLRIGEVPIKFGARVGESKLDTFRDGWRHLRYLLAVSPDQLFLLPGGILLVVGLVLLAFQLFAPAGIPLGQSRWRPAYGSVILEAVGLQIIWFGLLAKLYFSTVGLSADDPVVTWFEKSFSLERALGLSFCVVVLGVVIELAILLSQFGLLGQVMQQIPDLGPVGATALVLGVQSVFSSFMAYLLISEYARPRLASFPAPRAANGDGDPVLR
jgi:hypothetical protein